VLVPGTSRGRPGVKAVVVDVILMVLVTLLIPLAIIVIGAPLALFVRLLLEIAKRVF
jgi:hypothetical protein